MKYQHRFKVPQPVAAVAEFHRRPASMAAITPPPVRVQVHYAPDRLGEGDTMDFTLWLGPLPVRWLARIEEVSATGFIDRQERGPFRQWVHRHTFVTLDDHTTEVRDEIQAELQPGLPARLLGGAMWLNMPVLFAYRAWQTRRRLLKESLCPVSS